MTQKIPKQLGLQWGRAAAALSVVVGHSVSDHYVSAPGVWQLVGRFGVTLFFVISGYIMVLTTGPGKFDPLDFMRKRVLRIAPLYYIATALATFGVLIAPWAFKETVFDIKQIIVSLLFIPMAQPSRPDLIRPFLSLGWTLNFEMFFYVVFALLWAMSALKRAIAITVVFGTTIILGQIFQFSTQPIEFYTRVDTLPFVAGVWGAVLAQRYNLQLSGKDALGVLALGVLSVLMMGMVYPEVRNSLWSQVWLVASCALIVGVLANGMDAWASMVPRWLTYLGDASYSMYLFHMFAIGAVTVLARKLLPHALIYPSMAVAAVAGVGLSVVVYQYIERPVNRACRRWVDALAIIVKAALNRRAAVRSPVLEQTVDQPDGASPPVRP